MSQLLTEFPSVYVYKRQRFKSQNFIFSYQKNTFALRSSMIN